MYNTSAAQSATSRAISLTHPQTQKCSPRPPLVAVAATYVLPNQNRLVEGYVRCSAGRNIVRAVDTLRHVIIAPNALRLLQPALCRLSTHAHSPQIINVNWLERSQRCWIRKNHVHCANWNVTAWFPRLAPSPCPCALIPATAALAVLSGLNHASMSQKRLPISFVGSSVLGRLMRL